MKKLIAICAVVALVFSAYSPAYAGTVPPTPAEVGLIWSTELPVGHYRYVTPGIVTYGCNAGGVPFGHPTPFALVDDLTHEVIPPVQTVFWPHESIFAGVTLDLQAIVLPSKDVYNNWIPGTGADLNLDGQFNIGAFNWFFPDNTLALADGGGSVSWDIIASWQAERVYVEGVPVPRFESLALYGPGPHTDPRGLHGRVPVLPYGLWTVEIGVEDDNLFSTTTFQVIPEPATMILLGMGLLAGAAGLKKKKA